MRFRRGGPAVLLVALSLCFGLLAGCSDDEPRTLRDGDPVTAAEAQQVLDARADALRDGDLDGFLATLDSSDDGLLKRQRRYFANIQALPLETLRYTVLKSDWPAQLRAVGWDNAVTVPQVRVETQLEDYDTVPVRRITGFAFRRQQGRPVIVSELTGAGKQFPGSSPAPWDLVRVRVRNDGGTLQLYDSGTRARADEIGSVIRRGVADVQEGLPFAWDGRVVAYVFSKRPVLNSFEGVPGGNIRHLGAMTFPMYADLGQPVVAGIRFTLLPSSIRAGQPFLDRITRHELTHVAVGERDDGAPVWFAEGLAEWMGARSIAKRDRRIATVAVERARKGVEELPSSATFNGDDQAWNYAISWMACDYIAASRGADTLWQLMDALHAGGAGTTDDQQDIVLQQVIGMSGAELAAKAARRILRIYG